MRSAYWRKKNPPPDQMNPDRDRCGLLWLSPVAPIDGKHAATIADLATRTMLNHGFEPMLTITTITERALICVSSITYDREQPGEDERALSCYETLREALAAKGYVPYRLGIQSMETLPSDGSYAKFLEG